VKAQRKISKAKDRSYKKAARQVPRAHRDQRRDGGRADLRVWGLVTSWTWSEALKDPARGPDRGDG